MELRVTKYQFDNIIKPMQEGAILNCNEGANYTIWLEMPDGTTKPLRKQSAVIVTDKGYDNNALIGFGTGNGIKLNPRARVKII